MTVALGHDTLLGSFTGTVAVIRPVRRMPRPGRGFPPPKVLHFRLARGISGSSRVDRDGSHASYVPVTRGDGRFSSPTAAGSIRIPGNEMTRADGEDADPA